MISIAVERADAPGVHDLLQASDDFHNALYPPEENYLLDASTLLMPEVTVVVARSAGRAVGMGALVVTGGGFAEVKRMFVVDSARGGGVAGDILLALEEVARSLSLATIRLETGPDQPAAIAFYTRRGYVPVEAFDPYLDATNSLFFAKRL